jgi:hypothetical protein
MNLKKFSNMGKWEVDDPKGVKQWMNLGKLNNG